MTERENFFAIARRKGYERMPVQFNLCPYLQQTCGEKIRALQEETGFAFSPAVSARGLPVRKTDTRRFLGYYQDLKPGASIDVFGVAREPGSEAAMHMTHMRIRWNIWRRLRRCKPIPFRNSPRMRRRAPPFSRKMPLFAPATKLCRAICSAPSGKRLGTCAVWKI